MRVSTSDGRRFVVCQSGVVLAFPGSTAGEHPRIVIRYHQRLVLIGQMDTHHDVRPHQLPQQRLEFLPERAAVAAVIDEARARVLELTGWDGLSKLFTKNVLETALNGETTEYLGHEKNRAEPGRESTNACVLAASRR